MWQETDNNLYRSFEFKDFSKAFAFITRVALLAERKDHHPIFKHTYNKVEIWLTTYAAGNIITEKDRSLALGIDKLLLP